MYDLNDHGMPDFPVLEFPKRTTGELGEKIFRVIMLTDPLALTGWFCVPTFQYQEQAQKYIDRMHAAIELHPITDWNVSFAIIPPEQMAHISKIEPLFVHPCQRVYLRDIEVWMHLFVGDRFSPIAWCQGAQGVAYCAAQIPWPESIENDDGWIWSMVRSYPPGMTMERFASMVEPHGELQPVMDLSRIHPTMNPVERKIIAQILSDAKIAGCNIDVFDGEEFCLVHADNPQADMGKVFSEMFGSDEDYLTFYQGENEIGVVWLIYGNKGCLISDHTDNPAMEALLKSAFEIAEKYQ
jgi:hypothetical protein